MQRSPFGGLLAGIRDWSRGGWWLLAFLAAGALLFDDLAQWKVALWKVWLVSAAVYVAYLLDRNMFPGARPTALEATAGAATAMPERQHWQRRADSARLRRAILMAAITVAVLLGA